MNGELEAREVFGKVALTSLLDDGEEDESMSVPEGREENEPSDEDVEEIIKSLAYHGLDINKKKKLKKILKRGQFDRTFETVNGNRVLQNWLEIAIEYARDIFIGVCATLDPTVIGGEKFYQDVIKKAKEGVKFFFISSKWIKYENHNGLMKNRFLDLLEARKKELSLFENIRFYIKRGYPPLLHYYVVDNSLVLLESLHHISKPIHHINAYCARSTPEIVNLLRFKAHSCTGFPDVRGAQSIDDYLLIDNFDELDLGPEYLNLLNKHEYDISLNNPREWIDTAISMEKTTPLELKYNTAKFRIDIDSPKSLKNLFEKQYISLKERYKGYYIAWYRGIIINKSKSLDNLINEMPTHLRNYPYIILNCDMKGEEKAIAM